MKILDFDGHLLGFQRVHNQRSICSDVSETDPKFSLPLASTINDQNMQAESTQSAGPLRSTEVIILSTISTTSL